MRTFGLMERILEIGNIRNTFDISLVEDAAEALGFEIQARSAGSLGLLVITPRITLSLYP